MIEKSRETREVTYTCRYTSEHLIPTSVYINLKFQIFPYTGLFIFCNNVMTGEHSYTASKERIAPELSFHLNVQPNYGTAQLQLHTRMELHAWNHA